MFSCHKSVFVFLFLFAGLIMVSNAQVVNRELLMQDHEGKIMNSVNFNGKSIAYEFKFKDMEKASYFAEEEAIQRIFYDLILKVDGKDVARYEVMIRDLIVTMYMDINLVKDGKKVVISPIYNKTNKWVKLKGTLTDDCSNPGSQWGRMNQIKSFGQLLDFIITDFDKNVRLSCFD
jgi:hypothetical protein